MLVGKRFGQHGAQLRPGHRLAGECSPGELQHRGQVGTDQMRRELRVPGELRVEHRLHQRPQEQRVVGGHEVDRAAHHHDPDQRTVLEQHADGHGIEVGESRPEGEVRIERVLRLEPDEVTHRLERGRGRPFEEQLPGERGSIQVGVRERVDCHQGCTLGVGEHGGDPRLHLVDVQFRRVDVVAACGLLERDAACPRRLGTAVAASAGPGVGERGALRRRHHEPVGPPYTRNAGGALASRCGAMLAAATFVGSQRSTWVTGQSRNTVMSPVPAPAAPNVEKSLMPTKSSTPCTR